MKFKKAKDHNIAVSGDNNLYSSIVSADAGNNYLPPHLDASTVKIESRSTGLENGNEGILLYTNAGAGSTIGLENVFGETADAI